MAFEIRAIFRTVKRPRTIVIFWSCLLPKMRLSVVHEGRYIGYKTPSKLILTHYGGNQTKAQTHNTWNLEPILVFWPNNSNNVLDRD